MTGTPKTPKEIGDKTADGWTYIGNSVDTGKPLYVAPEDSGIMTWDDGAAEASKLQAQGKTEARLPSLGELQQIFNNKAKIPGLKTKGGYPSGWYWTSSPKLIEHGGYARIRRLSDGSMISAARHAKVSVRLVRS